MTVLGFPPAAVFGQAQLESQLQGPPGEPSDRQSQDGSFGLDAQHRRPTRTCPLPSRVQFFRAIGLVAFGPAVEQAAGNREFATCPAHIPEHLPTVRRRGDACAMSSRVMGASPRLPMRALSANARIRHMALVNCLHYYGIVQTRACVPTESASHFSTGMS